MRICEQVPNESRTPSPLQGHKVRVADEVGTIYARHRRSAPNCAGALLSCRRARIASGVETTTSRASAAATYIESQASRGSTHTVDGRERVLVRQYVPICP